MIWAALLTLAKSLGKRISWRGWLALAVCAALGLAAWQIDANAYDRGVAAEVARQQAVTREMQRRFDAAAQEVADMSAKIEAYEEASRMVGMEVDNAFRSDGGADRRVVTDADRRLLRRRWAAAPATTP